MPLGRDSRRRPLEDCILGATVQACRLGLSWRGCRKSEAHSESVFVWFVPKEGLREILLTFLQLSPGTPAQSGKQSNSAHSITVQQGMWAAMTGERPGLWDAEVMRVLEGYVCGSHCWHLLTKLLKARWISNSGSSTTSPQYLRSQACPRLS